MWSDRGRRATPRLATRWPCALPWRIRIEASTWPGSAGPASMWRRRAARRPTGPTSDMRRRSSTASPPPLDQLKQRQACPRALPLSAIPAVGTIAALLAARRGDVARLVTVASNLDVGYWTAREKLTPLQGSLDPADFAAALAGVPQVHLHRRQGHGGRHRRGSRLSFAPSGHRAGTADRGARIYPQLLLGERLD